MAVVMMQSTQPIALDAKHLQTVDPFDPARHAIIYNSRLSPNAKLLWCLPGGFCFNPLAGITCAPLCNIIQWQKLNARSYVRVYENRVDVNYATTICFGACIADSGPQGPCGGFCPLDVSKTTNLDKLPESVVVAQMCTPFHFCFCIECAGGVIAFAPMSVFNNCCFPQCRCYYAGLDNPSAFLGAITNTREVFRQGARLPAGAMITAPLIVQMA